MTWLRFFILVTCVAIPVLTASVPNMVKTPNTKELKGKAKANRPLRNKERYDSSVNDYMSERICGFNEMCKEEFSLKFRCRCPYFSYCSSPGRYYNAYCVISGAGYLWTQPKSFFGNQGAKGSRYKKKYHKTKGEKSLPRALA